MRSTVALVVALPLVVALGSRSLHEDLPDIGQHDNEVAAGALRDGEVRLSLEIRRGLFRPNGPDRPGTPMMAFAEPGGPLRIPGPLIRVPLGTRVRVSVRNASDSTVVVRGLSDALTADSLVLAPGASGESRFTASESGNRFYYGAFPGRTVRDRRVEDGHLSGAIVVDAPGARTHAERVILISGSFHSRDSLGVLNNDRESYGVNGRPWPRTQRLTGAVGDSIRFRVINASRDVHPMHLHGAYFRVDARGGAGRDSILSPEDRRMVVTEVMPGGSTMTFVWSPDRPGTWMLHCHLTFHVTPNPGFGVDSLPQSQVNEHQVHGHPGDDPNEHVVQGMGGIMMAIEVPVPRGWSLPTVSRRVVRFVVPRDSVANARTPYFAPSIDADGRVTTPPSGRAGPGATLFLRQGEPTTVRVLNESAEHLAIHWHGMELESLYDGVVGLGGTPDRRTRAVAPRDSFDALMTPPRAGTFIYHTHLSEVRQQAAGLYGPMIVLPRDGAWDAVHDHVFIAGTSRPNGVVLNGAKRLEPLAFVAGSTHRLRLINITIGSPGLQFHLVRADSSRAQWTRHAKDGMDLPTHQRRTGPSSQPIAMGETYDMLFTALEPGEYRLEARAGAVNVLATQPIRVVPPGRP